MCLAIPGQIVQFESEAKHIATIDVSGVKRQINVDLLRGSPLEVGDWVLIHVGFAMSRISEAQAREQLELLALLGEADEALQELEGYRFADDPSASPAPPERSRRRS